jgi:rod shape-determining protein MreC
MKLLFGQTISLQLRLFVAVLLSIVLIAGDKFTQGGTVVRTSLNTLVSPLIYVANLPYEIFSLGAKSLHTRDQLLSENEALKKKANATKRAIAAIPIFSQRKPKATRFTWLIG